MKASLIIIGNEILSGRTQDKNLSYLATWLNEIGVKSDLEEAGDMDVFRKVRKDLDEKSIQISDDELRQLYKNIFSD